MDKRKLRKLLISAGIGAVAGFVVAFSLFQIFDSGALGEIDTSRSSAALMGALFILCGGFVGLGLLNPQMGAKFLNVEDADELREQKTLFGYSVVGFLAFGAALIVLALAAPAVSYTHLTLPTILLV